MLLDFIQKFRPSTQPSDIRSIVTQICAERSKKKKKKTNITNIINEEPFDDDIGSVMSINAIMPKSNTLNSINSVDQFINIDSD